MRQIYVLDTSVLIHDPHSLKNFEDHKLIIPLTVLSELDSLKVGTNQTSHAAREAARLIDTIRESGQDIKEFSKLPGTNVEIKVLGYTPTKTFLPPELDINIKDNQIISTACNAVHLHPDYSVVLVSKDTLLRLTAESVGIKAENYKKDKVNNSYIFKDSSIKADITKEEYDKFVEMGEFVVPSLADVKDHSLITCDHHKSRSSIIVKTSIHLGEERVHQIKLITNKSLKPWDIRAKNLEQLYALYVLMEPNIKLVTMMGMAGSGKAQPLDEPVATPSGWKNMKDIEKGDYVFTESGKKTKVTGVYPQGKKDIYLVEFSDGSSTRCCNEHLWLTINTKEKAKTNKLYSVKTTEEIKDTLLYGKSKRLNHEIPVSLPVDYDHADLPLDPYLLGLLLGDGSFSQSALQFTSADFQLLLSISKELKKIKCKLIRTDRKYHYTISRINKTRDAFPAKYKFIRTSLSGEVKEYKNINEIFRDGFTTQVYRSSLTGKPYQGYFWTKSENATRSKNPLKNEILKLNLMKTKSHTKFIPKQYLFSSIEQRQRLLQGLMDTDGTISRTGCASYTTSSPRLAEDFIELINSLGGICTKTQRIPTYTYNGEKRKGKVAYTCFITLPNNIKYVSLKRKAIRKIDRVKYFPKRYIQSIKYVGKQEAQCLSVEDPSQLYLTKNYIVTHNTVMSMAAGLHQVLDLGRYKKVLVLRPTVSAGEELGFLPGDINEKLAPWMKPIHDNVEFILKDKSADDDTSKADYLFEDKTIEVDAISFIRGRSIDNAFIYIDEAQNLNKNLIKLLISRAGSKSKVIVAGDIDQIDSNYLDKYSCGLAVVAEKFREEPIAAHVILTKSERSKLAQLAAELL
jgi:predicted ribonuclease YlaK